jgi:rubrerythrin
MNKRIQFKLNERIFAVEIKTENSVLNDEDINNAYEELAEQINKNNETIHNIFFECLELVCSECGLSLNDDEKEIGVCNSCEGV